MLFIEPEPLGYGIRGAKMIGIFTASMVEKTKNGKIGQIVTL